MLEELLLSLLLDWLCHLAFFDLVILNHLKRKKDKDVLASPAGDRILVLFFNDNGAIYPFEDEFAAVVVALVPGCVGVRSYMRGLGIIFNHFDYRSDGYLI